MAHARRFAPRRSTGAVHPRSTRCRCGCAGLQARATASLPFVYPHLALMPDAHLGKGATVGSVIPTLGAIIPAAVGVDIGCGMIAVRTAIHASDLPDDRRTRHVRHWHKYFGANLPENHWFWFNWPDGRTYHTARNVDEFAATLADAPVPVLEKHLRAGDFSRWLRGMKSQDLGEIVLDVEVNFQKKHLNAEQARERVIAPFASLFGLSDAPAGVTE